MPNPRCRYCGKCLVQNYNEAPIDPYELMEEWRKKHPRPEYYSSTQEELDAYDREQRKAWRRITRESRIPTGTYGYGGDALFCSLRCGYAWAVSHVPEEDTSKNETDVP